MDVKLTIVRLGAAALGVIALISGGRAIVQGAAGKLGEAAAGIADANALTLLDNDFRFFAGIWLLVGVALIIGAILIHKKPDLVQVGLEAVFVGGLARLYAFTEFGYIAEVMPAILIELIVPPILLVMMKLAQRQRAEATA